MKSKNKCKPEYSPTMRSWISHVASLSAASFARYFIV